MTRHLSFYSPKIYYHHFWKHKEKFLKYEDVYEHWAIIAIEKGMVYYEIGDWKGTASFGDWLICPPNTQFRRVVVEPINFHFYWVNWESEKKNTFSSEHDIIPGGKITFHDTDRLMKNYIALRSVPHDFNKQKTHYLCDSWYIYCQQYDHETGSENSEGFDDVNDLLMIKAKQLIRQRAFDGIVLNEVADQLEINASQLTRRFKASFKMTPIQYLTSLRIEKAITLLQETELTLDQIAQCCGYDNGFYLSRIFSKQMHISPSEYRKLHKM